MIEGIKLPKREDNAIYNEAGFNAALGRVIILNEVLNMCAESAMSLNLSKWYHGLKQVHREIYSKLTDEERDRFKASLKAINIQLSHNKAAFNTRRGMTTVPELLYDRLDELDCQLRLAADQHGLLIPKKATYIDTLAMQD